VRKLTVVTSEVQFSEAVSALLSAEIVAFDTETTGLNPRTDKVVGFSFSTKPEEGYYVPIWDWNPERQLLHKTPFNARAAYVLKLLAKKKLVMHNGSFDCRMIYGNFQIDLTPALYCDTMLLKHTCDEEFPFALKQIAKKIQRSIGFTDSDADEEKRELGEHMKVLVGLENGDEYPMYKVPLAVLGKYAAADADLTYRLYVYYSAELRRQKLEKFFYEDEVMPLYREVTIPMEWHGIPIDTDRITVGLSEITTDIAALEKEILTEIDPLLSEFRSWFYNKDYPPKLTGLFPKALAKFLNVALPVTKDGTETLSKVALAKLPPSRFTEIMNGSSRMTSAEIVGTQQIMHGDSPTFNLSSKHHLKKLFFDKLGLEPISKTDKGNPQVDNEFLEKYSDSYPFIKKLVLFNKLVKLRGTYYERILADSDNGVFYPSFGQHRTISGRYGSDIQQLPRPLSSGNELLLKYNNQIREFFIAGAGWSIIDTDYNSLEPRVFAHVSGDPELIKIFTDDLDFYSTIAIAALKLTDVSANKKDPNYLGTIDPDARQRAKAFALGIAYGLQAAKLRHLLGISYQEADNIVESYLAKFKILAQWMNKSDKLAITEDKITTQSGRVRRFRARSLWSKWNNKFPSVDDIYSRAQTDDQQDAMFKERGILKNILNNAKNFQIQALSASIVNRSAIAISRALRDRTITGYIASSQNAYICANIHDQLIVRCKSELTESTAPIIQSSMESTYPLSVALVAKPQIGTNFRDAH